MLLRVSVASLLLSLSSHIAVADAFKCEPVPGQVLYQEEACPDYGEQSIVRIEGDSHTVIHNAIVEPDPTQLQLVELAREEERALRIAEAKREAKRQAKIEQEAQALVLEQHRKCAKYTDLFHQRVRQRGEDLAEAGVEAAALIDVTVTPEMLASTRNTMKHYCVSYALRFNKLPSMSSGLVY